MTDNAMVRRTYDDGARRVRATFFLPVAFEDTLIPLIETLRRE